jgi:hypothetical protein
MPFCCSDMRNKEKMQAMVQAIVRGRYKPLVGPQWSQVSRQGKDLIQRMLVVSRMLRPTIEDVSRDPWICDMKQQQQQQATALTKSTTKIAAATAGCNDAQEADSIATLTTMAVGEEKMSEQRKNNACPPLNMQPFTEVVSALLDSHTQVDVADKNSGDFNPLSMTGDIGGCHKEVVSVLLDSHAHRWSMCWRRRIKEAAQFQIASRSRC